ncbi:MAG: hypothetical protein RQ824_03165 [bacterium]|nr:hypothetical protein [bacterium]
MKRIFYTITVVFLMTAMTAPVYGAGKVKVTTLAEVEREVVNDKGEKEKQRVRAAEAKIMPGDEVIFTNSFINDETEAAENVVLTNAVPEHMLYIDFSAEGKDAKIDFSVDGGKSYGTPADLKVKDEEGNLRRAKGADYTHIRWIIEKPVMPGSKGTVGFRVQLK